MHIVASVMQGANLAVSSPSNLYAAMEPQRTIIEGVPFWNDSSLANARLDCVYQISKSQADCRNSLVTHLHLLVLLTDVVNTSATPAAGAEQRQRGLRCPDCGLWMLRIFGRAWIDEDPSTFS